MNAKLFKQSHHTNGIVVTGLPRGRHIFTIIPDRVGVQDEFRMTKAIALKYNRPDLDWLGHAIRVSAACSNMSVEQIRDVRVPAIPFAAGDRQTRKITSDSIGFQRDNFKSTLKLL